MLVDDIPENGNSLFALDTEAAMVSVSGETMEAEKGILDSIVDEVYKDAEPDPHFDAEDGIVLSFRCCCTDKSSGRLRFTFTWPCHILQHCTLSLE